MATVKVCPIKYEGDPPSEQLKDAFDNYSFDLDHFQKYAIEGILCGAHVLVTAATGSGKTLPAEFAIQHFCRAGERVIYTAPIKSLSNQKFREFSEKFPDISFGVLTGDIKFNPEADCIIMTTEILRNALLGDRPATGDFTLDVSKIKCVVFDEVHYINDRDRGMVWEETFIRLPQRVQTVMLSATIARAEQFAQWVAETTQKDVWLTGTTIRVVPLNHYSWWTLPPSSVKKLAGSPVESIVQRINDTFIPLKKQSEGLGFQTSAVTDLLKVTREVDKLRVQTPRRKYVFNCIARRLKDEGKLPALCFVFSRRKVMEHASDIEVTLFGEGEEKKPALVERECRHILSSKLPDYNEYLELPEYRSLLGLLQKGVAVHHSGMLPVLKEMVEMLFSRGYIKLLFATETFAVGVNMPTKTVLFSSLEKFDGNGFRLLHSHEYTQMAGRAGRRGLDTVGHVIHLNNLFDVPYTQDYAGMLEGKPQSVVSKFDVTFELLLRATSDSVETANRSMMTTVEIQREVSSLEKQIADLRSELITPLDVGLRYPERVTEYRLLQEEIVLAKNKHAKRLIREAKELEQSCPGIEEDNRLVCQRRERELELEQLQQALDRTVHYVENRTQLLRGVLLDEGFLLADGALTPKGVLASHLQEVAKLPFAEVLHRGMLDGLDTPELAAVLSCFTRIRVGEDDVEHNPTVQPDLLKRVWDIYNHYYDLELRAQGYVDEDAYTLHYDLQSAVVRWCRSETEAEARQIIQEVNTFLGEFVKAMLKVNAIALELQRVCERMDPPNVVLKHRLSQIPEQTLKYVVSNQSLYV